MKGMCDPLKNFSCKYQKPTAKMFHYIGFSLLMFAILIFLGWIDIRFFNRISTDLAWLASIALVVYYFFYDWKLAAVAAVLLIILNVIAGFFSGMTLNFFNGMLFLICAIAGIALIYSGFNMEGQKPKVEDYICGLVAVPLCMINDLLSTYGLGNKPTNKPPSQHK